MTRYVVAIQTPRERYESEFKAASAMNAVEQARRTWRLNGTATVQAPNGQFCAPMHAEQQWRAVR